MTVHDQHVRLGYRSGNCRDCFPSDTGRESWHELARNERLLDRAIEWEPFDSQRSTEGEVSPLVPLGAPLTAEGSSLVAPSG